jgi:glyoxylase-like metal-dependent hydrolase (beta-lactamase superfamily II)
MGSQRAEDSKTLAAALRRVLDRLRDRGKAIAVGHGPTNEAAAWD